MPPLAASLPSARADPTSTPSDAAEAERLGLRGSLLAAGLASVWVGAALNLPAWLRRAMAVWSQAPGGLAWSAPASEMALVLGLCALLVAGAFCLGRSVLRATVTLLVLVSALCGYFMTRYQVVIGYGAMQATLSTDHELSAELLGWWMLIWMLLFGLLPAWALLRGMRVAGLPALLRHARLLLLALGGLGLVLMLAGAGYHHLRAARHLLGTAGAPINHVGVAAHSYVPSNWLAGAGMVVVQRLSEARDLAHLQAPARRFDYALGPALNDAVVVLVIGETTRHDHMSVFGYGRDTTPHLRTNPDLAAFAAWSCDTSTKLSLACMFVRPESIVAGRGLEPDRMTEDNVFSVFRALGFSIDLFALQSEAGFYARVKPDQYKLREIIAAQPDKAGRRLDDLLLVDELEAAAAPRAGPSRPQLIVLHTKGSHYLYSQRYPRAFAQFTPECLDTDRFCSAAELINAYDNSIGFVDHVLDQMMQRLAGRKALLIYTSDHGESIAEGQHFHASPRATAPPEQRRVPLVLWASPSWRADPQLGAGFARAQARARAEAASSRASEPMHIGHHNLYATMLGCAGVLSADGGITAELDLCR